MNNFQNLIRAPEFVIGYHGCHAHIADQILQGDAFQPSTNSYDWLGTGIYFWEYAPFRAQEWARQRFGDDGVVLQAKLELQNCLNLLDVVHFAGLFDVYTLLEQTLTQQDVPVPVNRKGRHLLDKLVVDTFCKKYLDERDKQFDTVRGSFPEGISIYEGSKILSHTHVQIAIKNPACISYIEKVHFN